MRRTLQKIDSKVIPNYILVLFLLILFVAGYFLATDYGVSWDILMQMIIGEYNQTYFSFENFFHPSPFDFPGHEKYYGPIHEIVIQSVIDVFHHVGLQEIDLQLIYWTNFSSFLLGVFFFYHLARRYMRAWVALLTSILFFSQPLLFGHAFINSKDIPFLSFFIASVFLGVKMTEELGESLGVSVIDHFKTTRFALSEWGASSSKRKLFIIRFAWVWLIASLLTLLFWGLLKNGISFIILQIIQEKDNGFFGQLFSHFAANAALLSSDAYIHKGVILFSRFTKQSFLISFLFIVALSISELPNTVHSLFHKVIKVYLLELFSKKYIRDVSFYLINKWVLLVGVFAGITTSIRVLGPAAAGLVAILFISKKKEKSLAPITACFLVLILATYLTWPILWSTGVGGIWQTVKVMAAFPWNAGVLFNGEFYSPSTLPVSYLPTLLAIQLTEPVVIFFFVGLFLFFRLNTQKKIASPLIALVFFWLFIPLGGVIAFRPKIYDNFRQFLFILPPVFIIAGMGLEWLYKKIDSKRVGGIITIGILLPSILALITLHPYEYAYYNGFVGGVNGAFRQFETDYWATSISEAIEFVNENASQNAKILVAGPYQNVKWYGRTDLEVFEIGDIEREYYREYDYAILTTRGNADLEYLPDSPTVFQVKRGDVYYVLVKEVEHE